MFDLIVTTAFGEYGVGDRITDAAIIKKVLEEYPHSVVKTAKQQDVDAKKK